VYGVVLIFPASFSIIAVWVLVSFIFRFGFWFFSSGFLPFDVSNIFCFFIFEKKKIKLFFALRRAAQMLARRLDHFPDAKKMITPLSAKPPQA
jgi:hypothetical protein